MSDDPTTPTTTTNPTTATNLTTTTASPASDQSADQITSPRPSRRRRRRRTTIPPAPTSATTPAVTDTAPSALPSDATTGTPRRSRPRRESASKTSNDANAAGNPDNLPADNLPADNLATDLLANTDPSRDLHDRSIKAATSTPTVTPTATPGHRRRSRKRSPRKRTTPDELRPDDGGSLTSDEVSPLATDAATAELTTGLREAVFSHTTGAVLARGRGYARQHRVVNLKITQGLVKAKVQGSGDQRYKVELRATGKQAPAVVRKLRWSCNCPYAAAHRHSTCKHVVAVTLIVARRLEASETTRRHWLGLQADPTTMLEATFDRLAARIAETFSMTPLDIDSVLTRAAALVPAPFDLPPRDEITPTQAHPAPRDPLGDSPRPSAAPARQGTVVPNVAPQEPPSCLVPAPPTSSPVRRPYQREL